MPPRFPPLSLSASLRYPIIREHLAAVRPESIIEVGCGMGAMAYRLATAYDYRGYEPDRASFEVAEGRLRELGRGEILNEPLPAHQDRHFDALCAFEVLEHIEDDLTALKAWVQWLNPLGTLILSVPRDPERFAAGDVAAGHYRRYTRRQLTEVLNGAGVAVRAIIAWGMPVGYLIEGARNLVATRSQQDGTIEERTAKSGRWHQPSTGTAGRTRELVAKPFTLVQRPFANTEWGIGYIAVGRLDR